MVTYNSALYRWTPFLAGLFFSTSMKLSAQTAIVPPTTLPASTLRIVGYVPTWIDLKSYVNKIDYTRMTDLNIAFENPSNAAGDLSFNPDDDIIVKQAHAKGLHVLVSIGGGSASTDPVLKKRYFSLIADANRADFVSRLVTYVTAHNFDGIDVDIEGPSINKDYGSFIHDLGAALKASGKLTTAALSKGYGGSSVPDSVFGSLDSVNIMAYDAVGSWDRNHPGQHSSLDFTKDSVSYWIQRGLPKSKAVLGVPFYGYGFGTAYRNGDYSYSELVTTYPGAENLDQVGNTIWYNGIPTLKAKAQYVLDQGLAGVMIWELDYDVAGDKSLVTTLYQTLHPTPVVSTTTASGVSK